MPPSQMHATLFLAEQAQAYIPNIVSYKSLKSLIILDTHDICSLKLFINKKNRFFA